MIEYPNPLGLFTYFVSFHLYNIPRSWGLFPLYRWGNWSPKKHSDLRRVTQPVLGRARSKTQIPWQLPSKDEMGILWYERCIPEISCIRNSQICSLPPNSNIQHDPVTKRVSEFFKERWSSFLNAAFIPGMPMSACHHRNRTSHRGPGLRTRRGWSHLVYESWHQIAKEPGSSSLILKWPQLPWQALF